MRHKSSNQRFHRAKYKAKKRGIGWQLTFEQFRKLLQNKRCTYCSGPLPIYGVGLDRSDNTKGYSIDNVVPCCAHCNSMRGDHLTPKQLTIIQKVIKVLKEEGLWQ